MVARLTAYAARSYVREPDEETLPDYLMPERHNERRHR